MELAPLEDIHLHVYEAVNKLITDKTQNILYLIAKEKNYWTIL